MRVYTKGAELSSSLSENESSEKGDINFSFFASPSFLKGKEGSQRGDLKSEQNSKISQNKLEMSEKNQNSLNSNIISANEDLNEYLFNKGNKDHENKFDSVYLFGYQKQSFDNNNEKIITFNK